MAGWLIGKGCFCCKTKSENGRRGERPNGMRKLDGLTKDRLLSSFVLDLFRNGGGQNERKSGG
jgi:hypothetical protein